MMNFKQRTFYTRSVGSNQHTHKTHPRHSTQGDIMVGRDAQRQKEGKTGGDKNERNAETMRYKYRSGDGNGILPDIDWSC